MRAGFFFKFGIWREGGLNDFLFFLVKEGRLDLNNVVNYSHNEVRDFHLLCCPARGVL